ncbi:lytic transglycosylase domain-containing protein [Schwartzia sp. (in: firmicutes)]
MTRLRKLLKDVKPKTRKKYGLFFVVAVVLMTLVFIAIEESDSVQKKYLYPYPYQDLVEAYAAANGVDSALVASVIMNESKFKSDVHSHRGAIGLMQIMPETGEWIAAQLEEEHFNPDKLHDPETNIRYGIWYLAELKQEFNGNDILALAAYNAGRGMVHDWMEEKKWKKGFHAISEIPYPETREYVVKVLKNKEKYQKLYERK